MSEGVRPRVVVGVDGSPGARAALAWALSAAAGRGAALDVVAAFPVAPYWTDVYLLDPSRVEEIRAATEARARALVDELRRQPVAAGTGSATGLRPGDVPVTVTVFAGPAAEHLVRQSRGAELLVVGSRGRGGVRSTVMGSVALHCAAHARCPVVVVHTTTNAAERRVVVGLDDSPVSRAALRTAAGEAARLDAELEVVAAYQPAHDWSEFYAVMAAPEGQTRDGVERTARRIVGEVLGDADREPRPKVLVTVDECDAGVALVRRAESARLLVVGSRSRSQLEGIVLGSVALYCVVHAPCPVMVVHPRQSPDMPAASGAADRAGH